MRAPGRTRRCTSRRLLPPVDAQQKSVLGARAIERDEITNAPVFDLANSSQKIDKSGHAHCPSKELVAVDPRGRRARDAELPRSEGDRCGTRPVRGWALTTPVIGKRYRRVRRFSVPVSRAGRDRGE